MLTNQFLLRTLKESSALFRRNVGIFAPALQKASDPIQQLFVDKIREYQKKSTAAGGKMVDVTPDVERELNTELERVAKQYGAKGGEDMTKFPSFKFPDPVVDPINQTQ